ncbi:hypothetical protein BPTFM16_00824 [Altererythrobacter insulae]|nr:hypothetical protein BPTFM16_00824 [Altererythrobacter insulae]
MKRFRIVGFALLCSAAAAVANPPGNSEQADPQSFDNPAYITPEGKWRSVEDAAGPCRDEMRHAGPASNATSKAKLVQKAASPDEVDVIYAVDLRENGCSKIVVKEGAVTIHPLPKIDGSDPKKVPVDEGQ